MQSRAQGWRVYRGVAEPGSGRDGEVECWGPETRARTLDLEKPYVKGPPRLRFRLV